MINYAPKKLIKQIILMLILNAIYSGCGVGILSFINKYLLTLSEKNLNILALFFVLLILFLALSVISRAALCKLENDFVFDIRTKIIKQIIDTKHQKIEQTSEANLLASLSGDISRLTDGFMRISELVQGLMIVVFVGAYVLYISWEMFLFLFIWLGILMILNQILMKKMMNNFEIYRANEDILYKNYKSSISGHKELYINAQKAKSLYENDFLPNAINLRKNSLKAQIYQALAGNFMSVMMLGAVGVVLYFGLSNNNLSNAVTIAITILFLRAPLMMLVFSFPSILKAKIAYEKIKALNLDPFQNGFEIPKIPLWEKLELKNISFWYENNKFGIKNINLQINKGEIVFLIGANGSGKSTLFMILAGLYEASDGEILIDNKPVSKDALRSYSQNISAIFSDFYLFERVLGDKKNTNILLEKMGLDKKVSVENNKFSTTNLSTGQRKRLAMVACLLEERKFIMLDEWAADQDPVFRKEFYEQILGELKSAGYTIFAISHDDKYFEYADKIYKMQNGEIEKIK